jgi:glycosyltransferase involved in cell wall biosynthesis
LRVGVNTRLLLSGKLEGIGYFSQELLKRITVNNKDVDFVFFFDRKYDKDFVFSSNVKPVVIPFPARLPILWKIYFHILLPLYCKMYHIDVFFSPENYIPNLKSIPIISTVHDLNFFHDTNYIGDTSHNKYFLKYFPKYIKRSDKIITVSQFSKQDIISCYHTDEKKIEVIYNAANPLYFPQTLEQNNITKQKYTKGKDYFYFVGSIHKRKNLTNLFKAFDLFKENTKSDVSLVIIGNKKWWKGEIEDTYNLMKYKESVVFTGRLEAEDVCKVSSASLGLVFVSLFEGFGIPIVEAFSCHTPVITSNVTSMPEVAKDAALIVNPNNVNQISEAMFSLYTDKKLREDLINKGIERNKEFSWDKSADKLWKIIKSLEKKAKK